MYNNKKRSRVQENGSRRTSPAENGIVPRLLKRNEMNEGKEIGWKYEKNTRYVRKSETERRRSGLSRGGPQI